MKIETGKFYVNGRGDICGPMDERTPGVFLDQHGAVYQPDGKEWNHVEGSTANIVSECPSQTFGPVADLKRGIGVANAILCQSCDGRGWVRDDQ